MKIILKNEYGEFSLGGGAHPHARIINIEGLGIMAREVNSLTFEGQAGVTTRGVRDLSRTITMSFDFYGGEKEIEKLYRIIYEPLEILCFFGSRRRKISARCVNATDVSAIIYQKWQTVVLQFSCDNPYFCDFNNTVIKIATPRDMLPNTFLEGEWFVSLPSVATVIDYTARVENRGNTRIYPVIRLYSHKEEGLPDEILGVAVKNHTTKKTIYLNYSLSPEEVITIDLLKRKIKSNISGDITNKISDDTCLGDFYLNPGGNLIEVVSENQDDLLSAEVEFTNNYVAAVM